MEINIRKRDLTQAFANAMNLIDPEVQDHHEKVSYLAYQMAQEMGLDERQCQLALFGALMHDIGSVMKQGDFSLLDLERNAQAVSAAGSMLLKMFPFGSSLSDIIGNCQAPWHKLRQLPSKFTAPRKLSQIVHLADVVSLLFNEKRSVLNQVPYVQECVHKLENSEFSPDLLTAFDRLCKRESVWMDVLYRPQIFLNFIPAKETVSLEETVHLTEFMSRIIDFRSPFTAMHSAGVAASAVCLAKLSGMSQSECRMMEIAGYLHDIGKLKIPADILEKPGKLTDEEFNIMKEHAYYTYIILKDIRGFEQVTEWAAFHHEKLDGFGYPFHHTSDDLSLGSRIMTVADIFSALTEDRPYRKGMEKEQVTRILREDAEHGKLSSIIVELLIRHYDQINEARDQKARAASRTYQESLQQETA